MCACVCVGLGRVCVGLGCRVQGVCVRVCVGVGLGCRVQGVRHIRLDSAVRCSVLQCVHLDSTCYNHCLAHPKP